MLLFSSSQLRTATSDWYEQLKDRFESSSEQLEICAFLEPKKKRKITLMSSRLKMSLIFCPSNNWFPRRLLRTKKKNYITGFLLEYQIWNTSKAVFYHLFPSRNNPSFTPLLIFLNFQRLQKYFTVSTVSRCFSGFQKDHQSCRLSPRSRRLELIYILLQRRVSGNVVCKLNYTL